MKILLSPHQYLPHKRAGGETYLHRIAQLLISKGHEVRCLILYKEAYEYEGVKVKRVEHEKEWRDANTEDFLWADIVLTQLWGVPFAVNKCKQLEKKMIYVAHNTNQSTSFQHVSKGAYVLYNSEQLKSFLKFPQISFVLPPPINYRNFKKAKGEYITLVNHCEDKGGVILIEIAKRLPNQLFLAVAGGYGDQVTSNLPNIKYEPQQDISGVLSRSKIVLMPSKIETYGQVAIESYACGIPVIAHDTDGLRESMGIGGIFIDRDNIDAYVEKIVSLLNDPGLYTAASRYAINRAKALDPLPKLEEFHNWLITL